MESNISRLQPAAILPGTECGRPGFTTMMMTSTMTNERKIWEAALLLVRRHGNEAVAVAEREAERLKRDDDELTCVVWCWIARSTAELLRSAPTAGERVH
jgi:hypothetical protein